MVPGAKPADHPGFVQPSLAILRDTVPQGAQWIHEIKFDGYRLQAHRNRGPAILYTRSGLDWTKRFAPIAHALGNLPADRIVIDGELVVIEDGRPNFSSLQADLSEGRTDRMQYYAFDLLYLDGFDIRAAPLIERKNVLERLLAEAQLTGPVLYSQHEEQGGAEMFAQACAMSWEGIICKRRDAPYRSGRGGSWVKVKRVQRGEFLIVGYVPASGGQLAAVRLALRDGKDDLRYVGKAGTGFTVKSSQELRRRLEPLMRKTPALTKRLRKPDTVWVEPQLSANIEYTEFTSDGTLRHPSYKGLSGGTDRPRRR